MAQALGQQASTEPAPAPAAPAPASPAAPRHRFADTALDRVLLASASLYLASALLFLAVPSHAWDWARPLIGLITLASLIAIPASSIVPPFANHRGHTRRLNAEALSTMAWLVAITGGSLVLGAWSRTAPAWHFAATSALASIPLLATALSVSHRGIGSRRSLFRPSHPGA